jgi:hypothetical protein
MASPSMLQTLPYHAIVYGDPGGGKSHLAATCECPSIVLNFDGLGKARPYLLLPSPMKVVGPNYLTINPRGKNTQLERYDLYDLADAENKNLKRIIYNLVDLDPENDPIAWLQFKFMLLYIDRKMKEINGKTLIIDSATSLEVAYQHYHRAYMQNDKWGFPLADELQSLCARMIAKPYNTMLICHIMQRSGSGDNVKTGLNEFQGHAEKSAALTGRMAYRALGLSDNVFLVGVDTDGKHFALTRHDGRFIANNSFNAPMKCGNNMAEIMKNATQIQFELPGTIEEDNIDKNPTSQTISSTDNTTP